MECAEEQVTCHYLGIGHGHGPVRSEEQVIFAVFESTERDGNRVKPTAFPTKQLTRYEFSLSRLAHTTKDEFELKVIEVLIGARGPLVGIACASVSSLRSLSYVFEDAGWRAVCVIDKVTDLDFDGHAALGYADNQQQLGPKQKTVIRAQIQADLADAFGELVPITKVFGHDLASPSEQA
jgi:hypothetical protein